MKAKKPREKKLFTYSNLINSMYGTKGSAMILRIPPELKKTFKIACAERDETMRAALIRLIYEDINEWDRQKRGIYSS